MDVKNNFLLITENEDGQSIIEFILFLPFLLMTYTITMSISSAINGAINQQKVTRAYFYYSMQNNSTFPKPYRDGAEPYYSWNEFGMQIMGWSEKLVSDKPVMTCYKFQLPLGTADTDKCDDSYSKRTTQFIRVGTVYGVCGATYLRDQQNLFRMPVGGMAAGVVSSGEGCLIK